MRKLNTDLPDYIGSYTINPLINELNADPVDTEVSWNSMGGSVYAGQQFADFLNGKEYQITANVSGLAASMGAVLLPFFDRVIGSEQSDIMLHSASGGTDTTIKHTNKFLYEALAAKINEEKFESITGKKLKDVMLAEGDKRVDVWLTGKQAKQVGLFDESYDLLNKSADLSNKMTDIKELNYELPENILTKYGLIKETNKNDMEVKDVTATMLQAENPELYNSILGKGTTAERVRVQEILEYGKDDIEKSNALIKSGAELSKKDVAEFVSKSAALKKVTNLEEESAEDLNPAKNVVKEAEEKEAKEKEAALESLRNQLGTSDLLTDTKK